MKNTVFEIHKRAGFSPDAIYYLTSLTDKLGDGNRGKLTSMADGYFADETVKLSALRETISVMAKSVNAHPISLEEIFLSLCYARMEALYRENGIPSECFGDVLVDLRCKTEEGIKRFGAVGNGAFEWYDGFFRLKRFALGRLQFEADVLPDGVGEYHAHGIVLKAGDPVVRFHIPSSGKLDRDKRIDSYRKAYRFYPDFLQNGILPICCGSWLLYSGNRAFYLEASNLSDFQTDFEMLSEWEDPSDANAWRVFGCDVTDLNCLPETTSLQHRLAAYLRAGNHLGNGYGVIPFDGNEILR